MRIYRDKIRFVTKKIISNILLIPRLILEIRNVLHHGQRTFNLTNVGPLHANLYQ